MDLIFVSIRPCYVFFFFPLLILGLLIGTFILLTFKVIIDRHVLNPDCWEKYQQLQICRLYYSNGGE